MKFFDCPKCFTIQGLPIEDLPDELSDTMGFECGNCLHKFTIGWCVKIEVKDDSLTSDIT